MTINESIAALGVGKAWQPNIPEADGAISAADSAMLVGAYELFDVTAVTGLDFVHIYVAWNDALPFTVDF